MLCDNEASLTSETFQNENLIQNKNPIWNKNPVQNKILIEMLETILNTTTCESQNFRQCLENVFSNVFVLNNDFTSKEEGQEISSYFQDNDHRYHII